MTIFSYSSLYYGTLRHHGPKSRGGGTKIITSITTFFNYLFVELIIPLLSVARVRVSKRGRHSMTLDEVSITAKVPSPLLNVH